MPPKKRGDGAYARYNAKNPVITFRCDPDMRDAIHAAAKRADVSVGAYLVKLIREGMQAKPKPTKPVVTEWKRPEPTHMDEMKRRQLDDILKGFEDNE